MPIVPYQQHGGGQVPLRGFLSSVSSASPASDLLPRYTPISVALARDDTVYSAPDASHTNSRPSIDILVDHSPNQGPLEQAPINSLASSDESGDSDNQMKGRKPAIAAAGTFFSLTIFSQIYQRALFPRITPVSERAEERKWVASSQSWLDRRVCNWFGLCGLAHLDQTAWTSADSPKGQETLASASQKEKTDLSKFWKDASAVTNPKDFSDDERIAREIPQYVLEYAPYIHLYSGEEFWPCDIAEHLIHTTPHLNYTALQATSDHPNLTDLDDLNKWGRFVYLQSDDNVEDRPEWLGGKSNIPNAPDDSDLELDTEWPDEDRLGEGSLKDVDGEDSSWWNAGIGDSQDRGGVRPLSGPITSPIPASSDALGDKESVHTPGDDWQPELTRRKLGKRVVGGRSDAPAVLIVVEKDNGVVDAFFFFFYSYNLGNKVFNVRFGNHVGDWEHTVVRFQNGVPKAVFFSEHSFGEAYTYEALEKIGKRPVGYSATGTHAMYAVPGTHPYVLPGGVLHDETDRGPLWDPLLNLYSYTYDYKNDRLRSSNFTPEAPIGWFYFAGHWGDKFYPLSDPRQYRFVGQYHYVNGPMGPRFKNLGRQKICQGNDECVLKRGLYSTRHRMKRWQDVGEGEEMSEADVRRFMGAENDVETETR